MLTFVKCYLSALASCGGGESSGEGEDQGDNGWEGNPSAEEGSPTLPDYAPDPDNE